MNAAQLIDIYRNGLLQDVLPFWLENSVDSQFGGFITSLDQAGKIIDTDKSVWQQGRFTWLLGKLYNTIDSNQRWLDAALHGLKFIQSHCFDKSDGRMWFLVSRDGQPIRKRRYSYSESFAAIAVGELARATNDEQLKTQAALLFEQFLNESHRPSSPSKFTEHRTSQSIGIPMIAIGTAQQLRESIDLPNANRIIDEQLDVLRRFVKPEIKCVMECIDSNNEFVDHFDGRTLNPGHAIEAAWFVMMEGKFRNDDSLIELGCNMLDWMWDRGWDSEFGGMLYFVDVNGLPVSEYWHDMKFWWPHNETIIASLLAWLLTGNTKYQQMHQTVHRWAYDHFPDTTHGEWFGYLRRDGAISTTLKGNHWKGPFHLPRMQMTCWQLLEELKRTID